MDLVKIDALTRFSVEGYNRIAIEGSKGLIRLLCFEPEQSVPLHKHSNGDEYFLIVRGRGEFTLEDEESTVEEGFIVKAPAGVPHRWKNGSERLILLSILIHPSSYTLAGEATEMERV